MTIEEVLDIELPRLSMFSFFISGAGEVRAQLDGRIFCPITALAYFRLNRFFQPTYTETFAAAQAVKLNYAHTTYLIGASDLPAHSLRRRLLTALNL